MFEKGNNYGKGRPSGSQNKTTNQIKEYLQIITNHIEKDIISDIDCLTPHDRIKLWLSLQEYFIPKLAKQITSDSDNTIDVKINYIDE